MKEADFLKQMKKFRNAKAQENTSDFAFDFLDLVVNKLKMSNTKPGISKNETVGKNMSGALAGQVEGSISKNYKGMPRNANPNHPHNPKNGQSVADWTQNKMQERRKEAAAKK